MNTEFFIARRTAASSPDHKPGVMVRIAVISVAVSMAVMIVALAVIMGFKREVTEKIIGFTAHVQVIDIRGENGIDAEPVRRSESLENRIRSVAGFVAMHPYATKGGIVKTADAMQGVVLKGVDGSNELSFFKANLSEGALPRISDTIRTKDILVSRTLADKLILKVGDKVEMLFIGSGDAPRRDRFKVSGIYASGLGEMDNVLIITDIRNVQRLSDRTADEISGYEILTSDFAEVDGFTQRLKFALGEEDSDTTQNLAVMNVKELYPNIFDWLKAHDVNAVVIIVIMLIVAFFNMASALLILVLERTRMIGVLKAMGMRDGAVQRIFLYRAAFITLRGLFWGNLIGLGCCMIQAYFHVVKLNSEGYFLSEVPISLDWGWWLMLNIGVVAAIVALLAIPTYIISYIKPDESIRYN
ncbi:MAG: FtsX-like permease family protein [Alistipes sp.]